MTSYVQNTAILLANGVVALRGAAIDIADQAIAAANPGMALRRLLRFDGSRLSIGEHSFALTENNRIFVIGAGKATFPIVKILDDTLGERIHSGFVTCKVGQDGALRHIELHYASHPIPNEASHLAALRTQALLREVRSGDIVLACFTGGSSALFVDPVESVSLADKMQTNRILLECGANIIEINAVRKHLSRVKGGKLVRGLPAGARLINLTVSDVIGDHLDYITDPSVPDTSSFGDAKTTLDKYNLWANMPSSVTKFLSQARAKDETVREASLSHIARTDIVLVKNDAACHAAATAAQALGYNTLILSTVFEGESSELGRFMAATARQAISDGHPVKLPFVLIGGGECTVKMSNGSGRGGPNQEFATAFALDIVGCDNVVALSIDTDGTDGPTDIAGALVDGETVGLARSRGIDLYQHLCSHDVTPALTSLGATIMTGATGTNVNDLHLVIAGYNN